MDRKVLKSIRKFIETVYPKAVVIYNPNIYKVDAFPSCMYPFHILILNETKNDRGCVIIWGNEPELVELHKHGFHSVVSNNKDHIKYELSKYFYQVEKFDN